MEFPTLDTAMEILWALLLVASVVVAWFLTLVGMPGNWLIVILAALYVYLMPGDLRLSIGLGALVTLGVLAVVGEVIEFAAGAVGVSRVGGSRRSALYALLGSIVGGLTGMVVGVPIPVIGSVVAAVLFAGFGALAGAMLGEQSHGRSLGESWRVGQAAFWGRVMGTMAKAVIGLVMMIVVFVSLLV